MPAFEHLKKIMDPASQALPVLNYKQLYEDFTRSLWHAYKDLMQIAAKMMEPEFGFLFQKETQFEAGMAAWGKKHPWCRKWCRICVRHAPTGRTSWQISGITLSTKMTLIPRCMSPDIRQRTQRSYSMMSGEPSKTFSQCW